MMYGTIMASAVQEIEHAKSIAEAEKAEAEQAFKDDPEGFPEWLRIREEAKAKARQYQIEERRHREIVEASRRRSTSSAFSGLIGFIIGSSMN